MLNNRIFGTTPKSLDEKSGRVLAARPLREDLAYLEV
jgi:hypothetical protein